MKKNGNGGFVMAEVLMTVMLLMIMGSLTGFLILGIMEPMWNMYGSIGS